MSIKPVGTNSFLQIPSGMSATATAGTDSFSSVMRAVTDGNPSKEDIRTITDYLQMRMNESFLKAFGGGSYVSPWSAYEQGLPSLQRLLGRGVKSSSVPDGPLSDIINQAASAYQVDPNLISAVIKAESGGNPKATSPKGAMGLMQLMPATARDLGVTDAYDSKQNVMAGTKYLKGLLERYGGNRDLALAAYNWGMGNLEKSHRSMPQETVDYVARIKKYMEGKA